MMEERNIYRKNIGVNLPDLISRSDLQEYDYCHLTGRFPKRVSSSFLTEKNGSAFLLEMPHKF